MPAASTRRRTTSSGNSPSSPPSTRAIAQNKYLLLQHQVRLEVEETEDTVFSDEKWLCFILGQLITNGVKYRHPQRPLVLTFSAARGPGRSPSPSGTTASASPGGPAPDL